MNIVADFHIHSPYARATSPVMTLPQLWAWAKIKGIGIIGTGDFAHPDWFSEIKQQLEPSELGLFRLRRKFQPKIAHPNFKLSFLSCELMHRSSETADPRFLLTVEFGSIYKKNGKVRKIHTLIFAPSIEVAEKIRQTLKKIGNLDYDGRPIIGLDVKKLTQIILEISPDCFIVPAHVWTPWFSVFGSKSGFDSLEECFEEYTPHIKAIETGLSSDPPMNWALSALDSVSLISNSDSHSLRRIGREANVLDCELSYPSIIEAISSRDPKKFLYTIEYFPEEGRYHYDGHRKCHVSFSPEESAKHDNKCPSCIKPLTIGVLNRVRELADRTIEKFQSALTPSNQKSIIQIPDKKIPYRSMIPLDEIIAQGKGRGVQTKGVWNEYVNLIKNCGTEFLILFGCDLAKIEKYGSRETRNVLENVRNGDVHFIPGYDGEYGKIAPLSHKKQVQKRNVCV